MLIRRRVVQENPQPDVVENNVTVVRPERPTGLLVGLGIATLLAIGAVTYLSWYLPNRDTYATQPSYSGRAERFESGQPAPKPNTVVINPPPVIQTPPPVVTTPPVVVTPPSTQHTVIVPGPRSSDRDDTTQRSTPPRSNDNNNGSNNNGTNSTGGNVTGTSTTGDVDGTVVGSGR